MKPVDPHWLNALPSVLYTEVVTYWMDGPNWKEWDDPLTQEIAKTWKRQEARYIKKHHAE